MILRPVYSVTLVMMICIATIGGQAQSCRMKFEDANRAYQNGRYDEAVEKYHEILENGVVSGEVYFNLGNSYYKLNQYGLAILYYEKSKKFLEGDEALEKNLNLARLHTVDDIEPLPQLFLEKWWHIILDVFPLEIYAWITFVLFFLTAALIGISLLRYRNLKKFIWITGSLFAVALILFLNRVYIFESSEFGIILSPAVSIVSEPSISGTEVFILHEGTKVEISRKLDNWYEIKIADGKTGWLKNDTVEMI